MIDVNLNALLREYRKNPFEEHHVETPHTGYISFKVKKGDQVVGPSGKWKERTGTLLFTIEREKNIKSVYAQRKGQIAMVREDLDGGFVEAREPVLTIRHRLSKEEIINKILQKVLTIFPAPETARYYLIPEVEARRDQKKPISVKKGDEIIIMSLMKRDTFLSYHGPDGIIFSFYFRSGDHVAQGAPLMGVAKAEELAIVQKIIQRIQTEWED